MNVHMAEVERQLPLEGSPRAGGRARTDGIRLGPDGCLYAGLSLTDVHGVEREVHLRARPGKDIEETTQLIPEPSPPSSGRSGDDSAERLESIARLARDHLPAAAAADFLACLRPALRLVHAGPGDRVIAQLGGLPTLPINSWPVWKGHGPLSHVLSFDCGPVSELLPELGLPTDGRLAFFYFDGTYDNFESTVGAWAPETIAGVRVMHLHPESSTRADLTDHATPTPPGLSAFPVVPLAAVRTVTWPSYETPEMEQLWLRHDLAGPRPGVSSDPVNALYTGLWELPGGGYDVHQIGGHPCPQQGPVEMEAEQFRRGVAGEPFDWEDPDVLGAAGKIRLLLQVASDDDAGMMWGDVGQLYYLIADGGAPTDSLFTWQCG